MKTYLALSALLAYPERELIDSLPEVAGVLTGEARVPEPALAGLSALLRELGDEELYSLQERYVSLFDRSRALSLHLFEHVHGESRDRGQAMVDLGRMYEGQGLQVAEGELPDYVPAFLEYLSLLPEAQARGLLAETAAILAGLRDGLARRDSRYAAVFEALLAVAGEAPAEAPAAMRDPDPETLEALDREWAEEPILFGACSPAKPEAQPVQFYRQGLPA
jgi:nitrate reductase molybdenum cofactor assembly chaperone NarJ/NarW